MALVNPLNLQPFNKGDAGFLFAIAAAADYLSLHPQIQPQQLINFDQEIALSAQTIQSFLDQIREINPNLTDIENSKIGQTLRKLAKELLEEEKIAGETTRSEVPVGLPQGKLPEYQRTLDELNLAAEKIQRSHVPHFTFSPDPLLSENQADALPENVGRVLITEGLVQSNGQIEPSYQERLADRAFKSHLEAQIQKAVLEGEVERQIEEGLMAKFEDNGLIIAESWLQWQYIAHALAQTYSSLVAPEFSDPDQTRLSSDATRKILHEIKQNENYQKIFIGLTFAFAGNKRLDDETKNAQIDEAAREIDDLFQHLEIPPRPKQVTISDQALLLQGTYSEKGKTSRKTLFPLEAKPSLGWGSSSAWAYSRFRKPKEIWTKDLKPIVVSGTGTYVVISDVAGARELIASLGPFGLAALPLIVLANGKYVDFQKTLNRYTPAGLELQIKSQVKDWVFYKPVGSLFGLATHRNYAVADETGRLHSMRDFRPTHWLRHETAGFLKNIADTAPKNSLFYHVFTNASENLKFGRKKGKDRKSLPEALVGLVVVDLVGGLVSGLVEKAAYRVLGSTLTPKAVNFSKGVGAFAKGTFSFNSLATAFYGSSILGPVGTLIAAPIIFYETLNNLRTDHFGNTIFGKDLVRDYVAKRPLPAFMGPLKPLVQGLAEHPWIRLPVKGALISIIPGLGPSVGLPIMAYEYLWGMRPQLNLWYSQRVYNFLANRNLINRGTQLVYDKQGVLTGRIESPLKGTAWSFGEWMGGKIINGQLKFSVTNLGFKSLKGGTWGTAAGVAASFFGLSPLFIPLFALGGFGLSFGWNLISNRFFAAKAIPLPSVLGKIGGGGAGLLGKTLGPLSVIGAPQWVSGFFSDLGNLFSAVIHGDWGGALGSLAGLVGNSLGLIASTAAIAGAATALGLTFGLPALAIGAISTVVLFGLDWLSQQFFNFSPSAWVWTQMGNLAGGLFAMAGGIIVFISGLPILGGIGQAIGGFLGIMGAGFGFFLGIALGLISAIPLIMKGRIGEAAVILAVSLAVSGTLLNQEILNAGFAQNFAVIAQAGRIPGCGVGLSPSFNNKGSVGSSELRKVFIEAGNKFSLPPAVIAGIAIMEGGHMWGYNDTQIRQYSEPSAEDPYNCSPNGCGARGPMQFLSGGKATNCDSYTGSTMPDTWRHYKNAVNEGLSQKREPNICNIKDSIFAAAKKLKVDSKTPSSNWDRGDVTLAAAGYYGSCQGSSKFYCDNVYKYYTDFSECPAISSSGWYFSQTDPRWASHGNGTYNIAKAGCGPTSMAMVLKYNGINTNPAQIWDHFNNNGLMSPSQGTFWNAFAQTAQTYGLENADLGTEWNLVAQHLSQNHLVLAATPMYGGHILVITGVNGDTITTNDPYDDNNRGEGKKYNKNFVTWQRFWSIWKP